MRRVEHEDLVTPFAAALDVEIDGRLFDVMWYREPGAAEEVPIVAAEIDARPG